MITLHQAFYGRKETGYRLLASSNNAFNTKIEQLCADVGTPDGFSTVEPFYLNYIDGKYRYMIFCCLGKPDAVRNTLFFHVFVGEHNLLKQAHVGIAALIHNKCFVDTLPDGPIFDKNVDEDNYSIPWGKTNLIWNNEKVAIVAKNQCLELISGILKNKIDDVSWASFSFKTLNDFDLYAISEFVPLPKDRKCISPSGHIISMPKPEKQDPPHSNPPKRSKVLLVFLLLSLACNVLFVAMLVNKSDEKVVQKPITPKPLPEKVSLEDGKFTREEIIEKLRTLFYQNYRVLDQDFEECMKDDKALELQYFKYQKTPLTRAKGYIDFVNKEILQKKEIKNGN